MEVGHQVQEGAWADHYMGAYEVEGVHLKRNEEETSSQDVEGPTLEKERTTYNIS